MQFKFFSIHADSAGDAEAELNSFLRNCRAIAVYREFVQDPANPRWCLMVEYLDASSGQSNVKRRRVDYREVLSPEDFVLFGNIGDVLK